jgi:hypothetical protein
MRGGYSGRARFLERGPTRVARVCGDGLGYLWRAAFETSHAPVIVRLAPPALRPELPAEPVRRPAPNHGVAPRHRNTHVVVRRHIPPTTSSADLASALAPQTYAPAPTPAPQPSPKPRPKPTPAPKPTPPPTTQQPEQAPAAAPPSTPQPAPAPTDQQGNGPPETSKPGWGHGDKNHDHDGPPGDEHDK